MKRFLITLQQMTIERATVEVQANSLEEAKQKADVVAEGQKKWRCVEVLGLEVTGAVEFG